MPGRRQRVTAAVRYFRSPDSGLPGQGVRFVIAGGAVAVFYLALTTTLADGFEVPFQIALAVGYCSAVAVHFTLQRYFVWVHRRGFALLARQQAGRYLLVSGLQYGLTAAVTSLVPKEFGFPVTPVFLVTAVMITVLNFLFFRARVFHEEIRKAPGESEERG
jgi:putative flippase GtrA